MDLGLAVKWGFRDADDLHPLHHQQAFYCDTSPTKNG